MRRTLAIIPAALALIGARGGDAGAAEAGASVAPTLVDAEPLSVPIVDAGRVTGTLVLDVVFQTADDDGEAVQSAMPQLRAATRAAAAEHARLHASPWQAVDAEQLARTLDASAKAVTPAMGRVLVTELRTHRA